MEASPDDEALMQAYVAGDERAFDVLFGRYAPTVLRIGRRHLGSEDEARELVQQTFLRVHGSRRDYRADSRLHPWIMTIVMNLVRDQWRRRRRKPTAPLVHEPAAPTEDADAQMASARRADEVRQALGALSVGQREVVELHWFQERTFGEVARILGISEGTARVRAHRAYGKLQTLLAGVEATA